MTTRNTSGTILATLRILADPGHIFHVGERMDLIRKATKSMPQGVSGYQFGFAGDDLTWQTYSTVDAPLEDRFNGCMFLGQFPCIGNDDFVDRAIKDGVVKIMDNIRSILYPGNRYKQEVLYNHKSMAERDVRKALTDMYDQKPGSAGFGVAKALAVSLATFTDTTTFRWIKPLKVVDFQLIEFYSRGATSQRVVMI